MRSFASALSAVGLAVAAIATTGCDGPTREVQVSPWLRALTTESKTYGIFTTRASKKFEVRYFGFWHDVDAEFATVLSADTALLQRASGPALLHRGDHDGTPICSTKSITFVPPTMDQVDCIDVIETRGGVGGARRLAWKRLTEQGAVSAQGEISVDDAHSAVFPREVFYDEAARPYFLAASDGDHLGHGGRVDCLLITWRDGGPAVVANLARAPAFATCRETRAWAGSIDVRLQRPGESSEPSTRRPRRFSS